MQVHSGQSCARQIEYDLTSLSRGDMTASSVAKGAVSQYSLLSELSKHEKQEATFELELFADIYPASISQTYLLQKFLLVVRLSPRKSEGEV